MRIYKRIFILAVFFGVFLARGSYAEVSPDKTSDAISLKLKAGVITEAEFPEIIANVTKSVPSELLQIETLGNRMFLIARENFDSPIYVITQDNISYQLHLTVTEDEAMSHIKIKKPDEGIKSEQSKEVLNTIKLMKALIRGGGFQNIISSKLCKQEIFNNGVIRIVIDEIYEFSSGVKAISLTFENLTSKPIVAPIEHIELPGLLAISIESQILEARPQDIHKKNLPVKTKAYMIVKGLNQ